MISRMVDIFKAFALGKEIDSAMLDNMLQVYDDNLAGGAHAVRADATSRERGTFSGGSRSMNLGIGKFFAVLPVMLRQQISFHKSTQMAAAPHDEPYVDAPDFAGTLPDLATGLGAEMMGFAEVTPDVIYAGKSLPYRYAIVLAHRMDEKKIVTAPSVDCFVEVSDKYGILGVMANRLAVRIIDAGYDAVPGPALGGAVDYPSLARKAGLGEYGRHGMLISPLNGACQRLGAVFTNVRLPTGAPNPHHWVRDFCATCGTCIRRCPADAIRETPVARPGGHATCVRHDRCLPYFSRHYGCSVCIKVCPFTTVGYARIKERFVTQ